jgi:hypothetical protein
VNAPLEVERERLDDAELALGVLYNRIVYWRDRALEAEEKLADLMPYREEKQ